MTDEINVQYRPTQTGQHEFELEARVLSEAGYIIDVQPTSLEPNEPTNVTYVREGELEREIDNVPIPKNKISYV